MVDDLQTVRFLLQRFEDHLEAYKRQTSGLFGFRSGGYVQAMENSIDLLKEVIEHGGIANYVRKIQL